MNNFKCKPMRIKDWPLYSVMMLCEHLDKYHAVGSRKPRTKKLKDVEIVLAEDQEW